MSGIYIHIPFCKQACHYCDFHFSTNMKKKTAMIEALQKELQLRKQAFQDEVVETIYFGGGTPSVLSSEEIKTILNTVYDNYRVSQQPEITLEANPDDLYATNNNHHIIFEGYKQAGINRLSIGVQSFDEEDLQLMNRAHNAEEAAVSIQEAMAFFDNVSIDLIYGIPNMTPQRWQQNIDKALSFGVPHISSYALTVEPKTALASFIKKGIIAPVDDALAQTHFYLLVDSLEAAGFVNYEISNFGKPDYFSKNNTAYWQQKKYLGIGPSAHSFDGVQRGWNTANNTKYIKAITNNILPIEIEVLSKTDAYNEYVMTGLRTIWGVSMTRVIAEFGQKYGSYLSKQATKYIEKELLQLNDDVLLTTKKGRFLADGIAADLFMVNLD